ncbi:copper resistance protein CopC [Rarobacter faecitabidus]|uniref:CopC domain-containing protein n=1 Tax=Rarobacter faecitabidus TaxID=13243 RepID=A0A542ZDT4_RARFA|nr:copper resistance CopC family protein [Rarobacter faecitabidus]TQL58505.1 hypothetical protein FB461_1919 [Rarobacter faecitabidus]
MSRTRIRKSARATRAAYNTIISAIVLALFALGMFGAASVASAHDTLLSTKPADGAELKTLPGELVLEYSANLLETGIAIEVDGPDGEQWQHGEPTVKGAKIKVPLLANGPAGEYTVTWRVVSSDGHPISGEYAFTVTEGVGQDEAPATDPATPAAPEPSAPEPGAVGGAEAPGAISDQPTEPATQEPGDAEDGATEAAATPTADAQAEDESGASGWGRTGLFALIGVVLGVGAYFVASASRRRAGRATGEDDSADKGGDEHAPR